MNSKFFFAILLLAQSALAADPLFYSAKNQKFSNGEFCHLDMTVPVLAVGASATVEQKNLVKNLNAIWQQELVTTVAAYQNDIKTAEACTDYMFANQLDASFTLLSDLTAAIVSIEFNTSGYTGGAHGYNVKSFFVFNQYNGEIYETLASFVMDAKVPALKSLLEARLLENDPSFDLNFGWNDWKANTTSGGQISNYYFNGYGLVVYFNQYDIAPYAYGPVEIQLYWSELTDVLKSGGPADLLNK